MPHRYLFLLPSGVLGISKIGAKPTSFAGTDDEWEVWALAKTGFELGRELLTLADMPSKVREAFVRRPNPQSDDNELAWCRGNVHFADYVGGVKLGSPRAVEETDIPTDRTFRMAWEDTGSIVDINMPKARVIHMGRIRKARDVALVKLDVPFTRALEDKDSVKEAEIVAKKKALRDIPQTFDLSTHATPEDLKAAWPSGLQRD